MSCQALKVFKDSNLSFFFFFKKKPQQVNIFWRDLSQAFGVMCLKAQALEISEQLLIEGNTETKVAFLSRREMQTVSIRL